MPASPTQRTLKKLRDEVYLAQVVEKWNAFAKIRQDLFGIILDRRQIDDSTEKQKGQERGLPQADELPRETLS